MKRALIFWPLLVCLFLPVSAYEVAAKYGLVTKIDGAMWGWIKGAYLVADWLLTVWFTDMIAGKAPSPPV